jgi:glutathione S-transferase
LIVHVLKESSWKGLGETDERIVAHEAKTLDTALATYETILSQQSYLAGDEITLADLFHLSLGKLIKELGFPELFCKYPHVTAWMDELSERKSWLKVNPDLVPSEAPVCTLRR